MTEAFSSSKTFVAAELTVAAHKATVYYCITYPSASSLLYPTQFPTSFCSVLAYGNKDDSDTDCQRLTRRNKDIWLLNKMRWCLITQLHPIFIHMKRAGTTNSCASPLNNYNNNIYNNATKYVPQLSSLYLNITSDVANSFKRPLG